MNKNIKTIDEIKNNKEGYKEQYFKRLSAMYKIQRIYLVFTSIFVSTIIIFGIISFYQTKSIYSILLTAIGIIYIARNIFNFRRLKRPDKERINQEVEDIIKKSDESPKEILDNNK